MDRDSEGTAAHIENGHPEWKRTRGYWMLDAPEMGEARQEEWEIWAQGKKLDKDDDHLMQRHDQSDRVSVNSWGPGICADSEYNLDLRPVRLSHVTCRLTWPSVTSMRDEDACLPRRQRNSTPLITRCFPCLATIPRIDAQSRR